MISLLILLATILSLAIIIPLVLPSLFKNKDELDISWNLKRYIFNVLKMLLLSIIVLLALYFTNLIIVVILGALIIIFINRIPK